MPVFGESVVVVTVELGIPGGVVVVVIRGGVAVWIFIESLQFVCSRCCAGLGVLDWRLVAQYGLNGWGCSTFEDFLQIQSCSRCIGFCFPFFTHIYDHSSL